MFVVPDLHTGGAERHVTTLAPKLDPDRFEPSVICIGEQGELFAALPKAGVKSTALNLGGKRNAIRALCQLISRMRSDRPDIVVMRGYNAEILGRIASIIAGVGRNVVWVHSATNIQPRSRLRALADRLLIHWTSSYFGVAEAQRPYIVDGLHCPDHKVRIIHNGVELALFDVRCDRGILTQFGIDAEQPVVGIIASLRDEKDHPTLLRAARAVLDDVPEAQFLIVGDGPTRSELEALSFELGIADNVHFAGARKDIPQLLSAIDVFTLSSVTEAFPMSVLEAMACARPVVCTDVGGVSEVVENGVSGFLVPPSNPAQLAARLTGLLSRPDLMKRMGEAGRRRIEADYSLDRSVQETELAFEEIMDGRS